VAAAATRSAVRRSRGPGESKRCDVDTTLETRPAVATYPTRWQAKAPSSQTHAPICPGSASRVQPLRGRGLSNVGERYEQSRPVVTTNPELQMFPTPSIEPIEGNQRVESLRRPASGVRRPASGVRRLASGVWRLASGLSIPPIRSGSPHKFPCLCTRRRPRCGRRTHRCSRACE
jgi:hypothetical protein